LVDVNAGGLRGVVLARDVNRDLAGGAGENLGGGEVEFDEFALGDVGLDFGIGAGRVVVGGAEGGGEGGGEARRRVAARVRRRRVAKGRGRRERSGRRGDAERGREGIFMGREEGWENAADFVAG
jgi:hypothetical protein